MVLQALATMRSIIAPALRFIVRQQANRADGIQIGPLQIALSFGDAQILALPKKEFYGHLQVVIFILLATKEQIQS